ncbi:MAG: hydrogenase [Phycisphaerales bacterium]|nr:hydrogenase [Phycisphaerales bacterium]
MTSTQLILVAAGLLAGSGVPGLFADRRARWGEWVAVIATSAAAIAGLLGALLPDAGPSLRMSWGLPWGRFDVAADAVSRVFLLPVFLIPALGTIYGLGYWSQLEHIANGRKLRFFYGLMPAAMAVVILARDGALFLMAWEVMAISAFFLVTTEDDKRETRKAGWVYFVATHVGTLSLFAMFAVLRLATGSFTLAPTDGAVLDPSISRAVFILAVAGFGLKAGLMPLHVWLPAAHANAPSHVSAVLSGVMLKMGIYGLVRITGLLPASPAWWGAMLVAAGAVSAVIGLVFALAQHDLKRLLAYSSIENIGIITVGLGLALLGRSANQPAWAALGLGGVILHVWNHCLFKPLLFFGAGSIQHGAGTRRIERLGGLARRMPRTTGLFLVGSIAICALPPLNGFVSELLIYLGLFRAVGAPGASQLATAAAVAALAFAGGLAAAVFAKLFGMAFLGEPRSDHAIHAHESPATMIGPMTVMAGLCVAIGMFPGITAPLIDRAVAVWWSPIGSQAPSVRGLAPFDWLPFTSLVLLVLSGAGFLALRRALSPAPVQRPGTWDCGYGAPSPRMQYTGSSFGQLLGALFAWATCPRARRPRMGALFPKEARFRSNVPDIVLERAVLPLVRVAADFLRWARLLQQGQIQVYVLYILLTVLVLFISMYAV